MSADINGVVGWNPFPDVNLSGHSELFFMLPCRQIDIASKHSLRVTRGKFPQQEDNYCCNDIADSACAALIKFRATNLVVH